MTVEAWPQQKYVTAIVTEAKDVLAGYDFDVGAGLVPAHLNEL